MDVTIFDVVTIIDNATYEKPEQAAFGIFQGGKLLEACTLCGLEGMCEHLESI